MKKILLIYLLILVGCQHKLTINDQHIYYSSPALTGTIYFNGLPVADAKILLLTSCEDKLAISDLNGYFEIAPACVEYIPSVPSDELGYFYQLTIFVDDQQYLWRIAGLGYGFKTANIDLDLLARQITYQVLEGVDFPYEGIDLLDNITGEPDD